QYMRALFYNNELPTDEASVCWNDKTIYSLHGLNWTTSDVFVTAMFSRIYYQVSLCNEFIRRAKASSFADDATMKQYIAEARALRALSYYHAIDMFGNVPFATEANSVGSTGPDQISRKDLYDWLVTEIIDFTPSLPAVGANEYGRANQALGQMLLAKLYLNSEVYTSGA
ncbi:MAG: RagB/SusD family nutrient uptake outer membrane protein, partial [Bacteroidales bacterium]